VWSEVGKRFVRRLKSAGGAEDYRVLRQVQTVDGQPVEVGLFTDRMVIIQVCPVARP